jgi:protoheme IX farnesyltransferase
VTLRSLAIAGAPGALREPAAAARTAPRTAAALVELAKPRMVGLILVTTLAGFYMGSGADPDYGLLLGTLLGTGLAAAGSLALNQVLERDLDAAMERTKGRPLPSGRLRASEGLAYGVLLVAAGLAALAALSGPAAAGVTAVTVASYLFAYTPMKRRSPICTVVGAVPGALPPVTGWAAAAGEPGAGAAALFGIMFFWQLPHALAIAWLHREDYARAGVKLLPTVDPGGSATARQIVLNAAALLGAGLLPSVMGLAGGVYFATALAAGAWLLAESVRAARRRTEAGARRLLYATLVYVPVVLVVLALDRIPRPE